MATARKRLRRSDFLRNGFRIFTMHRFDPESAQFVENLEQEIARDSSFALPADSVAELDSATAANRYLQKALASEAIPDLTPGQADGVNGEFRSLGTETVLLTHTIVVKFRQIYNGIPVYGSLVTIELDERNRLLCLSTSLADPSHVNPIARISPASALKRIRQHPGYKKKLDGVVPQLHYYFDTQNRSQRQWRLVYITEDVPVIRIKRKKRAALPYFMDYFVDAESGDVVAELPRTSTMASAVESGVDEKQRRRRLYVETDGDQKLLLDARFSVQTFDLQFQDIKAQPSRLPGVPVNNPPSPWSSAAVSAQANAVAVATFLRNVLRRNSIDNRGCPLHSSINCIDRQESGPTQNVWLNAFWTGKQMVYGQKKNGHVFVSFAADLEVVGHEMFHGVTASSARLEYRGQSGALNESYSDIFGVIINNFDQKDVRRWNWRIGDGFGNGREPIRDMEHPRREGQPENMAHYRNLPFSNDSGGVHKNSGIHNHAAYFILTAADRSGRRYLTPREVAAVFYIALTQHLSRRSRFLDSRRAALLAARTLFRNYPQAKHAAKLRAIAWGFDRVGIAE